MPEKLPTRRVIAVVTDLFFAAKIAAVAKATGVEIAFAAPGDAHARCASAPPHLVVIDLHGGPDVPALVRSLKADSATRQLPLVGFHSHVDVATRAAAIEAGIDRALPRSAFVTRLADLLAGRDTPAAPPDPT